MKERMVPAQQLSDAGEDLVRMAAAKDEEIAALTEQRDKWKNYAEVLAGTVGRLTEEGYSLTKERDEWADYGKRTTSRHLKEIERLTEQRDRWKADCEDITTCLSNERQKFMEQRDRAMKVVEAAKALGEAMNKCKPCDKEFEALWAALDAEAAAETAPSLPETP